MLYGLPIPIRHGEIFSVEVVEPPEGPIVEIMKKKFGDKSLNYLNVWTNELRSPIGGSLSLKENKKQTKTEKLEEILKKRNNFNKK